MAMTDPASPGVTVDLTVAPAPISPAGFHRVAPAATGTGSVQIPFDSVRRRLPARLLIMGWVLLLMFMLLVLVNLVTMQALSKDVENEVDDALAQEIEEFVGVAAGGINRSTDQPYSSVEELLDSHLQRQYPNSDEVMSGVLPDGRIVRQARDEPFPFADRPERIAEIAADPSISGALQTTDGELRWRKVRVRAPSGEGEPGRFVVGHAIDRDRAEVHRTMRTLVLVSVIGLGIAGAGAYLVSGRILAPVRLVRQTAAEINAQDLTRRIPVRGRDDISALAEQFNAMLDRLSAAFSTQRRFLDDAGHELRTPITIVRGHLELMGDDPAERADVVRLVTEELDRMSRIVDDLLLLAKAERPDFVRLEKVSVADLTIDVHAKVCTLGERRWLLEAVGEGTADLDPQLITQAMAALADNAVKHTGPDAEIRIGSTCGVDPAGRPTVWFWVADTGPGVRPEDAETIFERFSRGARGSIDPRPGAGLGLAIVRAIAEAHRGVVRLVSKSGQGAHFSIVLPARPTDRTSPLTAARSPHG